MINTASAREIRAAINHSRRLNRIGPGIHITYPGNNLFSLAFNHTQNRFAPPPRRENTGLPLVPPRPQPTTTALAADHRKDEPYDCD